MQTSMLRRLTALAFVAFVAAASSCLEAPSVVPASDADGPTVILVSLDGTRPADVGPDTLPTLVALAGRGATASGMVPVFPTNTFPNHVTLVTGVEPDVHGIVNNVFHDPKRGLFRYANEPDWIEVEPLWSIAERNGVVSASYHWIGSEGRWRNGYGPTHWKRFDRDVDEGDKVAQILEWLDRSPSRDRPRLVTSWFRGADRDAHRDGPGAESARAALRAQDRALAALVAGLDQRGAFDRTILLVVSDHGMLPVEETVDLNAAFRAADVPAHAVGGGGVALVYAEGARADERAAIAVRAVEVARAQGLEAAPRGDSLDAFATANPRFGDAIVLAPVGWGITSRSDSPLRGSHGYPPEEPGMEALFVAAGAGVPEGAKLPRVRTLDVAPTILAWLGIEAPEWMQGRPIAGLVANPSPTPRSKEVTP
jgi:predicted AlkP superfamily pyrophosphatase or phosphodiesterase